MSDRTVPDIIRREPLVPADVDLRDWPYTPIIRARLFGSWFHANVDDAEWRAGVTLWLKSWDQVPAGTLPNDDVGLCRLAELGRDMATWRKVKENALHGWHLCTDDRLHHAVVAEGVLEAWEKRKKYKVRGIAGALARWGTSNASANENHATGTKSDGTSNASSTPEHGTSMLAPMLSDGKGSEGKGRENSVAKATALSGEQTSIVNEKSDLPPHTPNGGIDDKTWLFRNGLEAIAKAQGRNPKAVRSVLGLWLKDCGDDATLVRKIVEDALQLDVADPVAWITKAIETRTHRVNGAETHFRDHDGEEFRARLGSFQRTGIWLERVWGPKPGEPGCTVPPQILAEFNLNLSDQKIEGGTGDAGS